jgi:hypothetical protein
MWFRPPFIVVRLGAAREGFLTSRLLGFRPYCSPKHFLVKSLCWSRGMISFIQIPYRRLHPGGPRSEVGPLAAAVVLVLILCFQIGLLFWVFLNV